MGEKSFLPLFIFDVDDSFLCEEHAIAAVACGHHTIKHINPTAMLSRMLAGVPTPIR
jgi:hypothetical protein